uniref:Dof-type domain-containing protein n=1 Tax=Ananas comosus var. bracteatus TaxID=296719 RepID=A0A6V7QAU2_ANACO|nr:unnamed protein product [Ananas comosus var. bracteatus]
MRYVSPWGLETRSCGGVMAELRDPAIKLFGRTIAAVAPPPMPTPAAAASDEVEPPEESSEVDKVISKEVENTEINDVKQDGPEVISHTEHDNSSGPSNVNEDGHRANSEDSKSTENSKEQVKTEGDDPGQEKVLKKPDKVLPCPRCNSMDTKFCYYNNYNVNQPRHFCKNCQRYWTAGGTMRNVPVGAGRRKNKHSSSHYRHIMVQSDGPDLVHHQTLQCGPAVPVRPVKGNGTVLQFGPEMPLCESMASVLNIGEQGKNNNTDENREEPSCASSVTATNIAENGPTKSAFHNEQNGMQGYCNGFTLPPCYLGPPFIYPWGPGYTNVACGPENGNPGPTAWAPPPVMPPPGFCASTIPFPLVPASFWACLSGWPNGPWSMPWVGSNGGVSPSSSTSNSNCSGNGSPTLGKHSRDSSLQGEEKMEKSLWVPKTLRIDDPDEAAKSSIWSTLGIKPNNKGIFKPFQSKVESKGQTSDNAHVLLSNPAAFSRSQSFRESS